MADQIIFTASAIRALGSRISGLAPALEKVSQILEEADVESDAWSDCGTALAATYPEVRAFAAADVRSKFSQLDEMAGNLGATAET